MKRQNKFSHKIFRPHITEYLVFLISFLILSTISYEILKYGVTTAPDFLQNIFFSDLFSEKKTLLYCNELNEEIFPIFGGRGFRLTVNKKCLSHGSMHGFIIILGLAKTIWKDSFYFIVPFFASLALVFFYKICNFFFSKKTSFLGTVLLFFLPPFFFHGALLFNNIPALCFLLGTIFFLIKGYKENENWYFLSSFLAGIMLWIRYDYFLFIVPIFFFLLKEVISKSLNLKKFLLILVPFFLLILLLGLTNINLYGDFFNYQDGPFSSLANFPVTYSGNIETKKLLPFLPAMNGKIFFKNFYRYLVKDKEIFLLFFLLSLFFILNSYFKNDESKKSMSKKFFLLFAFFIIIPIFFYFFSVWSGFYEPQNVLANSYVRYLLPTYTFMIFFLLVFFEKLANGAKLLFLIFYLLSSLNVSFFSPGGIIDNIESQRLYFDIKENYLENIPEKNAVVFTTFYDKFIFPYRTTAIYNSFDNDEIEEKTSFAIKKLFEKDIPVYFLNDRNSVISKNKNFFENNGFKAIEVNDMIIKVEKNNEGF